MSGERYPKPKFSMLYTVSQYYQVIISLDVFPRPSKCLWLCHCTYMFIAVTLDMYVQIKSKRQLLRTLRCQNEKVDSLHIKTNTIDKVEAFGISLSNFAFNVVILVSKIFNRLINLKFEYKNPCAHYITLITDRTLHCWL